MGRRTFEVLTCDRLSCNKEFKEKADASNRYKDIEIVDHLKYMVKHNGSGSQNSNMSKMLCPECTIDFLNFMEG